MLISSSQGLIQSLNELKGLTNIYTNAFLYLRYYKIKTLFYIIDLLYQSFNVLNHKLMHMSFQFANSGNTKPSMMGLQQKAGQNCMSILYCDVLIYINNLI